MFLPISTYFYLFLVAFETTEAKRNSKHSSLKVLVFENKANKGSFVEDVVQCTSCCMRFACSKGFVRGNQFDLQSNTRQAHPHTQTQTEGTKHCTDGI